MITTTLNKIWEHNPCEDGWEKLTAYLGKSEPDDEPLSLLTILESNGLNDALWALQAVNGHKREICLFACNCACHVLSIFEARYPDDLRPRQAIETAALYAEGLATEDELSDARDAARDAEYAAEADARDAARNAEYAAEAAAFRAAWAAGAAKAAAGAAWTAWAAGAAAAGAAAWAAGAAEREYQKTEFIKLCNGGGK